MSGTAWKVSVFGVILVRIFPHSDWIRNRITPNTDPFYAVWKFFHFSKGEIVLPKIDQKSACVDDVDVFETKAIYGRIISLIGLQQINLETEWNYELTPIPTALFEDNGEMQYPKGNTVFMKTLEVTSSGCTHQDWAALVIDGNAIFWTTDWPNRGTAGDLTESISR